MLPISHVCKKFCPAKSIGDPGLNVRSSGSRSGWTRRVTQRKCECERCGGVVVRIRVTADYMPAATAKVEADGKTFNCEEYAVHYVMTS